MNSNSIIKKKNVFYILGVLFTIFLVLYTTNIVYALCAYINTSDGTIQEWIDQGVSVFQIDDAGDVESGSEDIVSTWIESGPGCETMDTIYFRMQTAAANALSTNMAAIAALDCNDNASFDDNEDRWVFYIRDCWDGDSNHSERAGLVLGDQSAYSALGPDAGQTVGSDLEWSVPISELPGECRDIFRVLFYTADVTGYCTLPPTAAIIIDQTEPYPWAGFNVIPDAITLNRFEATSSEGFPVSIYIIVAGLFSIVIVVYIYLKCKVKYLKTILNQLEG